jgi:putative transposon-encoded protein
MLYIWHITDKRAVSSRLKRNIQSVEGEVTKYGTGAHLVLPKEWLGRTVRVVLKEEEKRK